MVWLDRLQYAVIVVITYIAMPMVHLSCLSNIIYCSIIINTSLASQTHFHKKEKGLINCKYKSCPAALYNAVQSRYSMLSHDIMVLKTATERWDIFSATTGTAKRL